MLECFYSQKTAHKKNIFAPQTSRISPINLHNLLGCKNIVNNRVQKNSKNKIGFSNKCFSKSGNLCCKHIVHSNSFTSNMTKRTSSIFYDLDCKSKLVIYLMKCTLCHIQYISKSDTQFNLRLNNH